MRLGNVVNSGGDLIRVYEDWAASAEAQTPLGKLLCALLNEKIVPEDCEVSGSFYEKSTHEFVGDNGASYLHISHPSIRSLHLIISARDNLSVSDVQSRWRGVLWGFRSGLEDAGRMIGTSIAAADKLIKQIDPRTVP